MHRKDNPIFDFFKKFNFLKKKKRRHINKNTNFFRNDKDSAKFKSSRNNFKLFKSKLEFTNDKKITNIHIYYYLLSFLLIVMLNYLLFFSHYFAIKNIEILREDPLININIAYRSVDDFRYRQILLTDTSQIKNNLIESQKFIKNVNIRRVLPNTLKINLTAHQWAFQSEIKWNQYTITQNWIAIPNIDETLTPLNIYWLSWEFLIDYKRVLTENEIFRINYILNEIRVLFNETKQDIRYYKNENELLIKVESFWYLIFDLTQNLDEQISKLRIFNNEYKNNISHEIIYIDLRIIEKIYYCTSRTRNSCNQSLRYLYNIDID